MIFILTTGCGKSVISWRIQEIGSREEMCLSAQEALEPSDWEDKVFPVTLTSAEIEDSPGIETDLPFSLQKEKELRLFFKWREYWDDDVFIQPAGFTPMSVPGGEAIEPSLKDGRNSSGKLNGNPHLRSANEVQGYYIGAQDGEIGHVDDFIVEDTSWANPIFSCGYS